jgi:hypothetical protein
MSRRGVLAEGEELSSTLYGPISMGYEPHELRWMLSGESQTSDGGLQGLRIGRPVHDEALRGDGRINAELRAKGERIILCHDLRERQIDLLCRRGDQPAERRTEEALTTAGLLNAVRPPCRRER